MERSDAELVRASQAGDAASLGVLLERYRAPLYAQAVTLLGHRPEAQDAVQDAFLIALRSIDGLRSPEAVGGWLRTILRNACLMRLRKTREIPLDQASIQGRHRVTEPSIEAVIDRLALRGWVWTALAELPEELRLAAMLRYFGAHAAYEEIADILGVPVGTIRSRLNRARAKLADALLETAGLAHDEAWNVVTSRHRFFTAAFDQLDYQSDARVFASAFAADLTWSVNTMHNGALHQGRAPWVRLFQADVDDGVTMVVTNVLASKEITVIEADQINPPHDPFHCPPTIALVATSRGGLIRQVRAYNAPRS